MRNLQYVIWRPIEYREDCNPTEAVIGGFDLLLRKRESVRRHRQAPSALRWVAVRGVKGPFRHEAVRNTQKRHQMKCVCSYILKIKISPKTSLYRLKRLKCYHFKMFVRVSWNIKIFFLQPFLVTPGQRQSWRELFTSPAVRIGVQLQVSANRATVHTVC